MPKTKVKQLVDELQHEMDQVDSLPSDKKEKLEGLIDSIEAGLEDESLTADLNESLSETVTEFEASHPRLTAIINDIMVTLSNLGI